jgi:hypothetical protein
MQYDLGFIGLEEKTLQPLDNRSARGCYTCLRNGRYRCARNRDGGGLGLYRKSVATPHQSNKLCTPRGRLLQKLLRRAVSSAVRFRLAQHVAEAAGLTTMPAKAIHLRGTATSTCWRQGLPVWRS